MPTVTVYHKGSDKPWTYTEGRVACSIVEAAAERAMTTGETFRVPDLDILGGDILSVGYAEADQ
jgi:hypothetical protein